MRYMLIFFLAVGCNIKGPNMNFFHSERVSKTAVITLNATPDIVFPLFGPVEERKWADGWNPEIVYSESPLVEEHMIFKTPSHTHGESDYTWIVSEYDPDSLIIEYAVSSSERIWFIHIQCSDNKNGTTGATITYMFNGLTEAGNERSESALANMYRADLKDWEAAINFYLKTGKTLKPA